MAEELSKREQRRADRRENRHGRKQARIDRVQRKIDRTTGSTGSEDDLREARLKNRVQRIQNRKDKIGEGADAFRESWKRRRTDATSTDNVDASGLASNTSGMNTTMENQIKKKEERTPYTAADLKNLKMGSSERVQAYKDLNWADDETTTGHANYRDPSVQRVATGADGKIKTDADGNWIMES
jgi:hypothetical protein